jgi:hypothetical protein
MRYFRVTEVLAPYQDYSRINREVLEAAQLRGRIIHRASAAYALGVWTTPIPKEYLGYFESYKLWHEHAVKRVISAEPELIDTELGFLGHPDLVVVIKGDNLATVVDLKTPLAETPTWKAQIAAYKHLLEYDAKEPIGRCLVLRLDRAGGFPKSIEYQDSPRDFNAFVAALTAYRYFFKSRKEG